MRIKGQPSTRPNAEWQEWGHGGRRECLHHFNTADTIKVLRGVPVLPFRDAATSLPLVKLAKMRGINQIMAK